MTEAIVLPSKETYQLVSFIHAGGTAFYTDWTSDVPFGGEIYISTPEMEVKLPVNDGLFGEKVCNISVPRVTGDADNDLFADRISNGQPHATVDVIVREIIKPTGPGPSQNINKPFIGEIQTVRKNPAGNQNKIKIDCLPVKAQLAEIALGIQATIGCANTLGDAGCKVDLLDDNRTVSVVVASIDGLELTIESHATVEAKPDRFFHRGFVEFEGLNLTVRDWVDSAPLKLQLVKQAPAHWAGQTITLIAGCDQSVAVCRSRFLPPGGAPSGTQGNESNFQGAGIAMPPYHPVFEEGPAC